MVVVNSCVIMVDVTATLDILYNQEGNVVSDHVESQPQHRTVRQERHVVRHSTLVKVRPAESGADIVRLHV